jgi:very-short-patch-repair endonuclease
MEASGSSRAEAVGRAVRVWTGQLVDLTARNNLLYFRDLKVGTLDLGNVAPDLLYGVLAGKVTPLRRLFPDEDLFDASVRRARAVRNRSQEHYEERGLETLFLACGMATWANQRGSATPCAPVLLCPARLAPRGAAQEEFELSVTGELEVNPTLVHMLEAEFDCRCDPEALLSSAGIEGAIDTAEELDVAYRWLTGLCSSVPGFSVAPRFVLGTFSYAKLPMVKDLEGAIEAMVEHELIAALAGDAGAQAAIRERRPQVEPSAPDHIAPADEFLVLDADASQNYAINAVLGGQDLVVKGPPGTGKSQTIANLVSTLVARGQRVLFVAEKRAAIDAVLRRLTDVGLSDLVLDLHGGASSRRAVAQALASALATNASIPRKDLSAEHRLLETRRDQLNGRVEALHSQRRPWDLSYFDAQAQTLGFDAAVGTQVRFRGTALQALGADAYRDAKEALRSYAGLGGLTLASSGSPWASATVVSSEQAQSAQALAARIRSHTLSSVIARLDAAAAQTGLRAPQTIAEWTQCLALWRDVEQMLDRCVPELYELPFDEVVAQLEPLAAGAGKRAAARLTSGEYRSARKQLKQLLRDEVKLTAREMHACIAAAAEQQRRWASLAESGMRPSVPPNLADLSAAHGQLVEELTVLAAYAGRELAGSRDDVSQQLDDLLADTATLGRLPELHRLRISLQQHGLGELLEDLSARAIAPPAAVDAFEHAWRMSFIEHVKLSDARIGAFDGEQHSRTVAEYRAADRRHIESTPQRVRRLVAEQATRAQDEHENQGALIRDQAARKRKHLSVRTLFANAPEAMTALKPCWAMSPLLVSQLLPSDQQYFDVVVFDEASQVRPADAIPAILRGKRVVVAGDERQLPPTDFFTGSNPDIDAPELEGRVVLDAGYESILDAMLPFISFRMLGWHYRSRDERLIAFSNTHLYDRGMTTFPGVTGPHCIQHVHVPFQPGQHGSETSANAEVLEVVRLIIDHAERRPDESLGVIAMGIKHADRIDEALRAALHDRDDLEAFFDESRQERFFVKNLERVQGDERDAIILSVGYGKNADGRLLYRFGPLNQEGGERRLNVAITRAKHRMTLVSAFTHNDMDPDRSSARGVELLRLYLQYAVSRGENLGPTAAAIAALNPFEVDVRDTLARAGIPLTAQYGCSGFRIDFAAKHPTQPGRLVLAIECDGASYHSSDTARDRDRLRQEQLERLGWTFHRIWSQDWFNDKQRETDKALGAYTAAVAAADGEADETTVPAGLPAAASSRPADDAPQRDPRPPLRRHQSIVEYSQAELRSLVRWIESDTLLRTQEQLLNAMVDELGFSRRGKRIVDALTRAITAERSSRPHGR